MHLAMKSCCRSHCIFTEVFCIEGSFAACPKTDLSQLITLIPTHLRNPSPTGIGGGAARRVKVGDRQTPKKGNVLCPQGQYLSCSVGCDSAVCPKTEQ